MGGRRRGRGGDARGIGKSCCERLKHSSNCGICGLLHLHSLKEAGGEREGESAWEGPRQQDGEGARGSGALDQAHTALVCILRASVLCADAQHRGTARVSMCSCSTVRT